MIRSIALQAHARGMILLASSVVVGSANAAPSLDSQLMLASDDIERFTRRTLRALSGLPSARRAEVIMQMLEADPALAAVLPELRATIGRARYQRPTGPLVRDAVGVERALAELMDRHE
jgi:hypothetical protein